MYIKEKDEQRMVIGYTLGEQLFLICWNVGLIGSIIAAQFIPILVLRVIVSIILFGLLVFKGFVTNIVIDKLTESITVTRQYFLFVRRQHVIPFSGVKYAWVVEHRKWFNYGGTESYTWEVCLYYYSGKTERSITIDTGSENLMRNLALDINNFIGDIVLRNLELRWQK